MALKGKAEAERFGRVGC